MDQIFGKFTPGKAPFLLIGSALAIGIAIQKIANFPDWLPVLLTLAFILAIAALLRKNASAQLRFALLAALFCALGMWRFSHWETKNLQHSYLAHLPLKPQHITGTVESLQFGKRLKAVIALASLQNGEHFAEIGGRMIAYLPEGFSDVRPGQRIRLSGATLNPLPPLRNPGQFDYGSYLQSRGITAISYIRSADQVQIPDSTVAFSLENRLFFPLRMSLSRAIERYFSPDIAGILKALLLGVRDDVNRDIREDFQNAGVIHVLAISGLHVSFVVLFIIWLLKSMPVYFKHRNWLTILLLIAYMLLTGANPPVVRATTMAVIIYLGKNVERAGNMPNYLFAAASIILMAQPQQLFWIGFQLSFSAVAAIIYFLPKLEVLFEPLLERIDSATAQQRIRKFLILPYCASFAAQIGVVPLGMFYFQKFSLISFLINPPVILATCGAVLTGFVFLIFQSIIAPIAAISAFLLEYLMRGIVQSVHFAANFPFAYFDVLGFSIAGIAAYFCAIFLLFHFKNVWFRRVFAGGFAGTLSLSVLFSMQIPALDVLMLDVGQGDATLLRTAQRQTLLIDAGPATDEWSSADFAIIPAMQHLGESRLRGLFITHPHLDHYGGAFRLLDFATIDTVYLPPLPLASEMDSLLQRFREKRIPVRTLRSGDVLDIDAETKIFVLAPDSALANYATASGKNVNNGSLVLLVKHRESTLLFTGDAEAEAEIAVRKWGKLLHCDVLKVGHHGSKTSSTPGLLSLVKPKFATISAGKFNRFGHPDSIILRRLNAIHTTVFRTDLQQAIWLRHRAGAWENVRWK